MLGKHHELRATKSERSVDAESFIRAAKSILENEYGCTVELFADTLCMENTSFSPEYMTQALSLLATFARSGRSARIKFALEGEQLTITATAPESICTSSLKGSLLAESSADLGDFSYSVESISGKVTTVVKVRLKKCAAIALYAISKNELIVLIRKLIDG